VEFEPGSHPEVEMLGVISLILGIALLVAGRKLFWLFVGAPASGRD
jgi:hypothetical protein